MKSTVWDKDFLVKKPKNKIVFRFLYQKLMNASPAIDKNITNMLISTRQKRKNW